MLLLRVNRKVLVDGCVRLLKLPKRFIVDDDVNSVVGDV